MLKVLVLGSGAGGGFPQWNCNCPICQVARSTPEKARPRTQSSLAVSVDDENWFLLNASPDLRQQINENPSLHPKQAKRDSPIKGVVLTNADVDHIGGLITLRESQPLNIYATARVINLLAANSIFNILNPVFVTRNSLVLGDAVELSLPDGRKSGLVVETFAVPGKVALYLEDETAGENFGSVAEDTIGLKVSNHQTGEHFFYLPGCATVPEELAQRLKGAALLFHDGTTWVDDEMQRTGVGTKTGKRMGHMSVSGEGGSLETFADLAIERKIFIHINNTNPILLEESKERRSVQDAGWEVGFDGMEVTL